MKKHSLFIFTAAFLFAVISCSDSPSLYTVSYDTHGIGKQPHSISVSYGSKLTDAQLPNLTADGKVFSGWYKESSCMTKWNKNTDTVTQDITLYAKWQNTQPWTPLNPATELFIVTFDVQGVGTAPQKISVEKDSKLTDAQLPNLTADGKLFGGWYKESSCMTKWNKNTDT
ncbi:MAG: InlB B-repeat-containing protein, partial [Treponema sp.]